MKKSYYAIAGLLGAIGLVQLQAVTLTPEKSAKEMISNRFSGNATKPAQVRSLPRPHAAAAGATSRKIAAPETATIARGAEALVPAIPIRLLSSADELALAPGGFGDAGSLLAATLQASSFLQLPGESQSVTSMQFGETYGAGASAQLAGFAAGSALAPSSGFNSLSVAPGDGQPLPNTFANTFAEPSLVSAVPDSETWATLLTGLALVGFGMRRRSQLPSVSS